MTGMGHEGSGDVGAAGSYAPINGLRLYYEVHGDGPPLVLLHGGLMTIGLTFGLMIPTLAERHRVIGVELQGHGHTADIDRPMALESLAGDVDHLLGFLGVERADLFGFSLGGMVALTAARLYPERVGKLVIASVDPRPGHAEFENPDDPEVARRMPTEADFAAMRDAYEAAAPNPAAFETVAQKTSGMVHFFTGWSDDELKGIDAPTLVLLGDTDFVPLANAVAMFELLPRSELAVLPGTTHMGVSQRPEQVLALIGRFLDRAH
jgi:pimeloyl-ACP methyl ester carboxylesterase